MANSIGIKRRRCYLVRHGHVDYFDAQGRPLDPRSVSLSDQGALQARALGVVMHATALDRVLVSDYPRAQQTLDLVLMGRALKVESTPALREIRAGRLREIPEPSMQEAIVGAYRNAAEPDATFLGGERWSDFSQRVLDKFHAVLNEDGWESLLIVAHDAVNRIVLAWAAGTGLPGIAAFEQDTACLNVIDIDGEGDGSFAAIIRALNVTPYDPGKVGIRDTVLENLYRHIRPGKPLA
ncbi:histidine phosphatase family protein [Pseudomonas sp. KCJK9044]|uniref:histidine phosphatase family protein n=1 Tax=Pseudomonas sp. KCJK9044 TaxID=3344562 RepID=UPI00390594E5